ncbi:MAG TPA: hypothetical protein VK884_03645 [Verrucomicrobiae bacterium]|jgi:hypothetical protein|nr:hypothetical protein [Verrucomicrobiae bacterium]
MKLGKIAAGVMAIALVAGVARNARAQAKTLEAEQSDEDLHDAEAAAKRHRAELMKIPHVRVVTGEVDGQNEAAILVEVDEQKNIDAVTRQLPSQIEGFPVEVDESAGAAVEGDFSVGAFNSPPKTINSKGYNLHTLLNPPPAAASPDAPQ